MTNVDPTSDPQHSGPGPLPFAVTGPPALTVGANRRGSTTFTVTNLTGRPVKARLVPHGVGGTPDGWFSVSGDREIPLGLGATVSVAVAVDVPPGVAAGPNAVGLRVVLESDPEMLAEGPVASFDVPPEAPAARRTPWLPILLIVVAVLAILGGGLWWLLRPQPPTTAPPPSLPPSTPVISPTSVPPETCLAGFRFREAYPGDVVCVTQETWAQVRADNAQAASRVDPNGAYGPRSCVQGYVWRVARSDDLVCVTVEQRTQAQLDNEAAPTRRVGP